MFFVLNMFIGNLYLFYIVYLYVFVTERIKMADIVSDEENEFAVPKFTIDGEITRQ